MKKAIFVVFLLIILMSSYGCSLFAFNKHNPEVLIPEVLISGDIEDTQSIHISDIQKRKFGKASGYALIDFLNKIVLLHQNYDVMVLSRDGKAIMIEGETVSQSYLLEKKGGVLELYSNVHYNFEKSFLPLSAVSEFVILARAKVSKGIPVNGGSIDKISTTMQLELLYMQLRACESNGMHIIREYSKEVVEANKLLGDAQSAKIKLLDGNIIFIEKDTTEILDWKKGSLVLRSTGLPIISISIL